MKRGAIQVLCLLILSGLWSKVSDAAQIININVKDEGNEVSPNMFGANFVFSFNNLNQLKSTLPHLRQQVIRYPGGSITEEQFNPVNPMKFLNGNNVPTNKRIDTFINMVNQNNWIPVFVIPTIRYSGNRQRGVNEIRTFVRNLLNGSYGNLDRGSTIHFEIGNEFYWSSTVNAAQYGRIASDLLTAISKGIKDSTRSGSYYKTQVSVQSGWKDDDAKKVARSLKGKRSLFDFLTYHWYPGRAEIQLGLRANAGTNELFSSRLNSIAQTWRQNAGYAKPFFLSEYNISSKGKGVDRGLRNPLGLMTIFAEGVRGNAQMSTVWPLIGRGSNLPSKFFRLENNDSVTPLTNAKFFRLMYDSIGPDAGGRVKIIDGDYGFSTNFRNDPYTVAFKVGNNKVVVFVFGTEHSTRQVKLNLQGFKIRSRRGDTLFTDRGKEEDANVVAQAGRVWPRISDDKRSATFTLNKNSKYEVVRMVFTGTFD